MNDNLIEDYRTVITNSLLQSPLIVDILGNSKYDEETADELLWKNLYPVQFIPQTITDTDTYIFYDIEENTGMSETYLSMNVIFWVVTHKNLLKYNHKLRLDVLAREIKGIMRKDCELGIAKNHFVYNRLLTSNGIPLDYTGRIITFRVTDWSDKIRNGE